MLTSLLLSALVGVAQGFPHPQARASGPQKLSLRPVSVPLVQPPTNSADADDATAEIAAVAELADSIPVIAEKNQLLYMVDINMGTPPQVVNFVMDTGSSQLIAFTAQCTNSSCDSEYPKFNISASTTFNITDIDARMAYLGGQRYTGKWASDTVQLGNTALNNFVFPAITGANNYDGGAFGAAGILGLSWGLNSTSQGISITRRINDEGASTAEKRFGVYLDRIDEEVYGKENVANSELTLDGIDEDKIQGEVYMADIWRNLTDPTADPPGWFIPVGGLKFGDKVVDIDNSTLALIDTGNTAISLPVSLVEEFFKGVGGARRNDNGFSLPCNATGLNMTITFGGHEFPVYWGDLLSPVDDTATECFGRVQMLNHDAPNDGELWILGSTFMRNVYSVFSYEPPQVGFGELKPEYNKRTNRIPRKDGQYTPSTSSATSSSTASSVSSTAAASVTFPSPPSTLSAAASSESSSESSSSSSASSGATLPSGSSALL